MAVVRCEKGHFYDGEKYRECPHCGQGCLSKEEHGSRSLAQKQLQEFAVIRGNKEERTVGLFRASKGGNPIVGWLVCMNGGEWGRDFRMFAGKNKIGRALNMDIVLADDLAVARENHCYLIFEPRKVTYLLQKGVGDRVLVNGEPLEEVTVLHGEESIEIGNSTFIFIPFCKEGRMW